MCQLYTGLIQTALNIVHRELNKMNESKKFSMRFDGGRFKNQKIPFDSLSDVALIGKMVMDVASDVFLEENPERRRVPRNFKKNYHLSMTGLSAGSSVVEFTISNANPQQFFYSEEERSIEIAIDDVVNFFDKGLEVERLEKRKDKLRPYLRTFGRSLREGERIEFNSGEKKIIYNQKIRH